MRSPLLKRRCSIKPPTSNLPSPGGSEAASHSGGTVAHRRGSGLMQDPAFVWVFVSLRRYWRPQWWYPAARGRRRRLGRFTSTDCPFRSPPRTQKCRYARGRGAQLVTFRSPFCASVRRWVRGAGDERRDDDVMRLLVSSSDLAGRWRGLAVCGCDDVVDVGEVLSCDVALEAADDLLFGASLGGAAGDVVLGGLV
jgi:hypothetical protein